MREWRLGVGAGSHPLSLVRRPCPVQEPYLCPRCLKAAGPGAASGGKPLSVEFARASGGDAAWRLAELLGTRDYR